MAGRRIRVHRGRVYPLPCLLTVWLCALTAAGHDGACAVGQWVARASPVELARLRLLFDPFTGRHRVPDEATLRRLLARVDRDVLAAALLGDHHPRRGRRVTRRGRGRWEDQPWRAAA